MLRTRINNVCRISLVSRRRMIYKVGSRSETTFILLSSDERRFYSSWPWSAQACCIAYHPCGRRGRNMRAVSGSSVLCQRYVLMYCVAAIVFLHEKLGMSGHAVFGLVVVEGSVAQLIMCWNKLPSPLYEWLWRFISWRSSAYMGFCMLCSTAVSRASTSWGSCAVFSTLQWFCCGLLGMGRR